MRRDLTAGRPTGRVLAGRAALLAVGVGTVLGAGAGIASADETLPAVPGTDTSAVDTSSADTSTSEATPGVAPNLSTADGRTGATGRSSDIGTVSGDDIAGLGDMSSDRVSGVGSGS